jgi:L-ascorbate metabolism protein UlaG (beta-lactamase superfamily)
MTIQEMLDKMTWLGHDTFRIDGSQTVYFDPFNLNTDRKADLVLVTHVHYDHCSPDDIRKIVQPATVVVTEKDAARKLSGNVKIVKPGDSLVIGDIKVEAVPAYNTNKDFHPKANGWLGFILEMDGVRIYHAGDTDRIPEMESLDVDIALLPVSGTYVMTADEAVEAAQAINPGVAVPMHYGAIVGGSSDADTFKAKLEGRVEVRIL